MFDFTTHTTKQTLLRHLNFEQASIQVLVERADRLVLKVQTATACYALKAAATPEMIHQEVANNNKLAAAGLPVAHLQATGDQPMPFVLHTWIKGTALHTSHGPAVMRETAALLRRIHQIGGKPPYAGNDSWDQWMKGWLHHALPWWQKTANISAARISETWHIVDTLQPLLATRGNAFILFDGRPDHFLIANNRIAGLIDLGEARSGDPAMDLGVIAANNPVLLTQLLPHYEAPADELGKINRLIPFYTFLRLLALAEWHVHQSEPERAASFLDRAARHTWPV
ncbi:MAG: aminoglycoside phosphotransferase family protein [Bacteroidota bacterium]